MELGVGHLGGALLAGWLAKELCAPQRAEPVSAPCACVCKCDSPESSPFPWAIVIVLVAGPFRVHSVVSDCQGPATPLSNAQGW